MKIRSLVTTILLVVFNLCAIHATLGQETKQRVITRLPTEQNEPIVITAVRVHDQSIAFGEKFDADDDWLKKFSLSVKNKSDKLILFASIQLQFPRSADSQGEMAVEDVFYGNWALKRRPPAQDERIVGIAPGETVVIAMTEQESFDLQRFLSATGFSQSIERVDIRLDSVIFADDSMWTRGATARRDPQNPSTWKKVNPEAIP